MQDQQETFALMPSAGIIESWQVAKSNIYFIYYCIYYYSSLWSGPVPDNNN